MFSLIVSRVLILEKQFFFKKWWLRLLRLFFCYQVVIASNVSYYSKISHKITLFI